MRLTGSLRRLAALGLVGLAACADDGPSGPAPAIDENQDGWADPAMGLGEFVTSVVELGCRDACSHTGKPFAVTQVHRMLRAA